MDDRTNAANSYENLLVMLVDKQLSLIDSLMPRNAYEFSEICQVYFREKRID